MFKVHVPAAQRVAELNPAAYNPRKITPEKFEALKESINSWAKGHSVQMNSAKRISEACQKLGIRMGPPRPTVERAPHPGLAYTSPASPDEGEEE